MRTLVVIILVVGLISSCKSKVQDGVEAYNRADYQSAKAAFETSPESGEALFYLGKMYQYGLGVQKDAKKAVTMFHDAESRGYSTAYLEHGKMLIAGEGVAKDRKAGLALLERASSQGIKEAYVEIGRFYVSEDGGKRGNLAAAAFRKSDSLIGDYQLALLNEKGTPDFAPNPSLARALLESALERQEPESKRSKEPISVDLAEYYLWGFGGPADEEKALSLLTKYPGSNTDDLRAWILFTSEKAPRRSNEEEAVKIWLDLARQWKDGKVAFPRYAYLGLATAYSSGMGVSASNLSAAVYREKILPLFAAAYILPGLLAEGVFGHAECGMEMPSGNPGRYVYLLAAGFKAKTECYQKKGNLTLAHITAWRAEQMGLSTGSSWQREIERSMSSESLATARLWENVLASKDALSKIPKEEREEAIKSAAQNRQ